jgi:hypothetical protein
MRFYTQAHRYYCGSACPLDVSLYPWLTDHVPPGYVSGWPGPGRT